MDTKIQEAVGLLRHKIISPVLVESGRSQMEYFRKMEREDFDVPGKGLRKFKASTMKIWLMRYKKHGFTGLKPKSRSDKGGFRRIDESVIKAIEGFRKEHMEVSVAKFYDLALKNEVLGHPPLCLATVRRFLKIKNLFPEMKPVARKRFEMSRFGEMWIGDFMHGPHVLEGVDKKKKRKAILMAFIDDHSRVITGGEFGFYENTTLIEKVFKNAILTYGIPLKIYVDNGASFSSQYLSRVCAHLGIGLVHSKPYDSPSRGKIERFFRSVRDGCLSDFKNTDNITLENLNTIFSKWLRDYHHKEHKGINGRPIDRYQTSMGYYPLKRISDEELDEFFMISLERTVNKDATISISGKIYEAPSGFIGKRVELRYSQEDEKDIYIYENNVRVAKLYPCDPLFNGKYYKPLPKKDEEISYQEVVKYD
jgi:putative transposase